jgi:hypothetical protein
MLAIKARALIDIPITLDCSICFLAKKPPPPAMTPKMRGSKVLTTGELESQVVNPIKKPVKAKATGIQMEI